MTLYKAVGIWFVEDPTQIEAFERHYQEVHLPLAARLPGLVRIVATRMDADLDGNAPGFHRAAELQFTDKAALRASAESAEWAAMRADRAFMLEQFSARAMSSMGAANAIAPDA